MVNWIIMRLLDRQLKKVRTKQNTPYIYIRGTGKDYPKYVMYTDDAKIAERMHNIQ